MEPGRVKRCSIFRSPPRIVQLHGFFFLGVGLMASSPFTCGTRQCEASCEGRTPRLPPSSLFVSLPLYLWNPVG